MRKLKNSELERISVENFKTANKTPIVVVLDSVRSALNVGSAFRTSDAFRIEKIYLCGITAFPPNKEIRKSALGATDSVEWEKAEKTEDIILKLKKEGYVVSAIEQAETSVMLNNFPSPEKPIAVVFGNEVNGVQQSVIDLCDNCIEIPQIGTKHSLNISVSVGVVLWDLYNKINR
ncbi:MAG: RNA methyltransferase [Flavobacteriales bacterium]|jgi:tRNA G18 (ribose-2'-O)-methylase SpoU|nr:RNA methyltransferase [Flavobacteriales bacterium]MBT7481767.1 RNA methyltransferase [Flavobacteriales bacterium]